MEAALARARAASETFIRDFYDEDTQEELLHELGATDTPVPAPFPAFVAPAAVHHVVVDPATAISPESRAMLAQARRNHMRLRINDELSTTITNSVHCTTRSSTPGRNPSSLRKPLKKWRITKSSWPASARRWRCCSGWWGRRLRACSRSSGGRSAANASSAVP